jgi:hypothetical protein
MSQRKWKETTEPDSTLLAVQWLTENDYTALTELVKLCVSILKGKQSALQAYAPGTSGEEAKHDFARDFVLEFLEPYCELSPEQIREAAERGKFRWIVNKCHDTVVDFTRETIGRGKAVEFAEAKSLDDLVVIQERGEKPKKVLASSIVPEGSSITSKSRPTIEETEARLQKFLANYADEIPDVIGLVIAMYPGITPWEVKLIIQEFCGVSERKAYEIKAVWRKALGRDWWASELYEILDAAIPAAELTSLQRPIAGPPLKVEQAERAADGSTKSKPGYADYLEEKL